MILIIIKLFCESRASNTHAHYFIYYCSLGLVCFPSVRELNNLWPRFIIRIWKLNSKNVCLQSWRFWTQKKKIVCLFIEVSFFVAFKFSIDVNDWTFSESLLDRIFLKWQPQGFRNRFTNFVLKCEKLEKE